MHRRVKTNTRDNHEKRGFLLRSFVWVVLFMVFFAGFKTSGMEASKQAMREEAQAAATQTAALESGGSVVLEVQGSNGVVGYGVLSAASGGCSTATDCRAALAAQYQGNEMDLLPAYRWKNPADLSDTYGTGDQLAGRGVVSAFADLLFSIAGWVWSLLVSIVAVGLRMDPLFSNSVGERVNTLFYGLSQGVSAGFVWFACVASIAVAIVSPLRGKGAPSITSVVIGVAVPLGALWAMTTAANPENVSGSTGSKVAVGSPIWLGRQGVSLVDGVTGFAADNMNQALSGVLINDTGSGSTAQLSPSCAAYTQALHDSFKAAWENDFKLVNTDAASKTKATVNGKPIDGGSYEFVSTGGKNGAGSLIALSSLWESSFLPQWVSAQFGGGRPGYRIYCHYLDRGAGIPAPEQATVGVVAGYPAFSGRTLDKVSASTRPGTVNLAPVGPTVTPASGTPAKPASYTPPAEASYRFNPAFSDPARGAYKGSDLASSGSMKQDGLAKMFMWAACTSSKTDINGKALSGSTTFVVGDAWAQHVDELDGTPAVPAQVCQKWWSDGNNYGNLEFGEGTAGDMQGTQCQKPEPGKPTSDCEFEIGNMVMATHGKNASVRFFAGAMALFGAVAYLWVLGMLALGLILAKIGFIMMLMLLPLTLFLLAVPKWRVDPKRAQRNQMGLKLIKRTMGFAAASTVFQFSIIILILTIALVRSILIVLPAGNGIVDIAAPLIALFLVKKLGQKAGLGDIASPSGALGLGAAAAAGLAGGGMAAARARSMKNQGYTDKDGKKVEGDFAKAARLAKGVPNKLADAAKAGKAGAASAASAIKNAPETLKDAADKAADKLAKGVDGIKDAKAAVAGAMAAVGSGAAGAAAMGAVKSKKDAVGQWAKDMMNAAGHAKTSITNGLAGGGAGAATVAATAGAAAMMAATARSDSMEAKTADALAGVQASIASGMSEVTAAVGAAAAATVARENTVGAAASPVSIGQNAAQTSQAIADGAAAGKSAGEVMSDQRTVTDGARAIEKAAEQISAASGGAVTTDQARHAIYNGTMGAFVQLPDGSTVTTGEAIATGKAGVDAAGNLVMKSPGCSMVTTGGSGASTEQACIEAAGYARAYDSSHSLAGAAAAAAKAASDPSEGGIGVPNVGAVRGTGGLVVPLAGGPGVQGGVPTGANIAAMQGSTAAATLAFNEDTAQRVLAAVGGDTNAAAAVLAEGLALRGCGGATLGAVVNSCGYDASVGTYDAAAAGAAAAIWSAPTPADQASALDDFRNTYGLSLSDNELAACVQAAGATMMSYAAQDIAVLHQPVAVAQERAMAAVEAAQAELGKDAPDVQKVAEHFADAAAYTAVAKAAQADVEVYAATGGNVVSAGMPVDVAGVRAAAQAEYVQQLQELDFIGRHTQTNGRPDPSAAARAARTNGEVIAQTLVGEVQGYGGTPTASGLSTAGTFPSINSVVQRPSSRSAAPAPTRPRSRRP